MVFKEITSMYVGNMHDFDNEITYWVDNKKHESKITESFSKIINNHHVWIAIAEDGSIVFSVMDKQHFGKSFIWRWNDEQND